MKIAILGNNNVCYGSLVYFLSGIEKALKDCGIQTEFFPEMNPEIFHSKWDAVIGINQSAFSARLQDGRFLFDYLECPLFLIIVDPPYHFSYLLRQHPRNLHLICLDEGHIEFSKKYYGPFQSVQMGYLLGGVSQPIPYECREMDVLFMGSHVNKSELLAQVNGSLQDWQKDLFEYLIHEGIQSPNISIDCTMRHFFESNSIEIPDGEYLQAVETAGGFAEYYLRTHYREQVLAALLSAGINVAIAGIGWESYFTELPHHLKLLGNVDFSEASDVMVNAKISLNVMPWFKDGLHDRILTSMYNESICLTDGSSYIKEHFEDGKDLVLYDLQALDVLADKVLPLLNDVPLAEQIIRTAKQKVQENYSWKKLVTETILPYLNA